MRNSLFTLLTLIASSFGVFSAETFKPSASIHISWHDSRPAHQL